VIYQAILKATEGGNLSKFIAEIGSNHNNDINRTFRTIDACKDAGFWGVKFQLFKNETLFREGFDKLSTKERQDRQLDFEFFKHKICVYCKSIGIAVGVTPFDIDYATRLQGTDIDFVKISSFDILRFSLIDSCLKLDKPIMISTGLATEDDIVKLLARYPKKSLTLMYCVSDYPTQLGSLYMKNISKFKNCAKTGYSDHSVLESAIYSAVLLNDAQFIEVHVDLDGEGFEYDVGHCWLIDEIKPVIKNCLDAFQINEHGGYISTEQLSKRADPKDGLRPCL